MAKVATDFNSPVEERDANQIIFNADFELRFHPDDRGFAFMTCKIYTDDEVFISKLEGYFSPFMS